MIQVEKSLNTYITVDSVVHNYDSWIELNEIY
jgi:hypothetical protein